MRSFLTRSPNYRNIFVSSKSSLYLRPMATFESLSPSLMNIQDITLSNRNITCNLPIDSDERNVCRSVRDAIFVRVNPTPVEDPLLLVVSPSALNLLGINHLNEENQENYNEILTQYLSGNLLLKGSIPLAHNYAGYQFGHFSGQLGDGAAILLGDNDHYEIQLKGAGKTPFSRQGDGRKVLRSSLREFLCSEYMACLGIPTTRAASLVVSRGTSVARDPFYSGVVIDEPCAVVSRVAKHFFRFGSLQICEIGSPAEGCDVLRHTLLRYLLLHYFEYLLTENERAFLMTMDMSRDKITTQLKLKLFEQVSRDTAQLVSRWQTVGFVHGVLNTDNMSLEGLTLDYGPFGFLEHFDSDFVPNGSDTDGRYSYGRQPAICRWNLKQLFTALQLDEEVCCEVVLGTHYDTVYRDTVETLWRRKLAVSHVSDLEMCRNTVKGFSHLGVVRSCDTDETHVVKQLLWTLQQTQADFTDVFQAIAIFVREIIKIKMNELEIQHDTAETQMRLLQEQLVCRLKCRSASPKIVTRLLQKRRNIHRITMPATQLQHLCELIATHPETLATSLKMTVNDIRQELRQETRRVALVSGHDYETLVCETLPMLQRDADLDMCIASVDSYRQVLPGDARVCVMDETQCYENISLNFQQISKMSETAKTKRDTMLWQRWVTTHYVPLLMSRVSHMTWRDTEELMTQQRDTCPSVTLRTHSLQHLLDTLQPPLSDNSNNSCYINNNKTDNICDTRNTCQDTVVTQKGVSLLRDFVRLLVSPSSESPNTSNIFNVNLSSFCHDTSAVCRDCTNIIQNDCNIKMENTPLSAEETEKLKTFLQPAPEEAVSLYCTCSS